VRELQTAMNSQIEIWMRACADTSVRESRFKGCRTYIRLHACVTTNTKRQKRRKIKQSQVNGLADARRKEIEGDDGNGGLKKEISDLKMRSRVAQDELVSARSIPPR